MTFDTRWLASVVLLGIALANIVAYRHARAMLRFSDAAQKTKNPEALTLLDKLVVLLSGIDNPRPADLEMPEAYDLRYEQRRIPVAGSHVTLGAWLVPHAAPVGYVIFFHGYTAAKSDLLPEAAAFHERGYAALLVDFRGSAESSERYTTIGYVEADDVKAAIAYAVAELGFVSPIIYARSMGAAALTRALWLGALPIRAVILEGVFDRMVSTVKERFYSMGLPATPFAHLLVLWGGLQHGFWAFAHNPVRYAASCTVPTLMLHGSEDARATLAQARSVFDALRCPKTFCEFPGAGHEPLRAFDRARWNAALDEFLNPSSSR